MSLIWVSIASRFWYIGSRLLGVWFPNSISSLWINAAPRFSLKICVCIIRILWRSMYVLYSIVPLIVHMPFYADCAFLLPFFYICRWSFTSWSWRFNCSLCLSSPPRKSRHTLRVHIAPLRSPTGHVLEVLYSERGSLNLNEIECNALELTNIHSFLLILRTP